MSVDSELLQCCQDVEYGSSSALSKSEVLLEPDRSFRHSHASWLPEEPPGAQANSKCEVTL